MRIASADVLPMDSISHQTFAYYFLSLLMEGAPFILLGTLVSGVIDVYMPSGLLERVLPKRRVPAILLCGLLGLVLPVCECAVVPVIRRLVAKGLPVSCAFTYMLAAPIVNPVTILSTLSAFSDQEALYMTISRVGIGYTVAVFVGLVLMAVPVEKILRKSLLARVSGHDHKHHHGHDCCGHTKQVHHAKKTQEVSCCGHDHDHDHESANAGQKLVAAARSGMKDFIDVAVYFTIGVCLTAMFNILQVDHYETINRYAENELAGTGILMLLAFVLSVCSTSDAFLAATLGAFGYGSKMAFMVFGPMLDVKLIFLYQTVMKKSFLLKFCVGLALVVGGICLAWESWDDLRLWMNQLELGWQAEGGAQ